MAQDPIVLLVRMLGEMYVFLILMRFLLQMVQADYYNPISQAIAKITNVPVVTMAKAIPRIGRFDFSALLYAILIKIAVLALLFALSGSGLPNLLALGIYSLIGVLSDLLTIIFWAVLASVVISWIAPGSYHPGPQLIEQLTEPIMGLARRVIPPLGGLDLSPIVIFIIIQLIQSQLRPFVL